MAQFTHVMSPIRVAGHLLKNRIISGPSTIHTASNGEDHPTEAGIRFFEDRAKAGAGLVTCAGVSIGGFNNDGVHCSWDITIPNRRNALCDLSERIHLYGAKCTMELIGVLPDGWTVSDGCSIMGGPVGRGEAPLEVLEQFKAAQAAHFDLVSEEKTKDSLKLSTEYLRIFVEYMYAHFDAFKLILCRAEGTRYANFLEELVELEVECSEEYYALLRKRGKLSGKMTKQLHHMITSAYFTAVCETIVHDMPKEEAMRYIEELAKFFNSGWKGLLRLE